MKPLLIAVKVIKVGLSSSKKVVLFASMKTFEKWWKMLFILLQKVFSFSRLLNFCIDFLSYRKSGLIRKIRFIWKFMTPQPVEQTIAIHILPNILRSKSNQLIKFGQVIEYSKKNIFLQKPCRKWARETSSRHPFDF